MDMLDKARPQALQRSTVTDVISVLRIGRGHVAPLQHRWHGGEGEALRSPQSAPLGVPDASLVGEGGRYTFNRLCELFLRRSYPTSGPNPGTCVLSAIPPIAGTARLRLQRPIHVRTVCKFS